MSELKENYKNKVWLENQLKTKDISEVAKLCNCNRQNIMYYMKAFGLKSLKPKGRPVKYNNDTERKKSINESVLKYHDKRKKEQTFNVLTGISKNNSEIFSKLRRKTQLTNDELISFLFKKTNIENFLK